MPAASRVALVFSISSDRFLNTFLHNLDVLGDTGEIVLIDSQKTLLAPLKFNLPDETLAQPLTYKQQLSGEVRVVNTSGLGYVLRIATSHYQVRV